MLIMRYLARLDDGSQKFFEKRLAAMSWARREAARWCKVYLLSGQCPLVGYYLRGEYPSRYIPQPIVGLNDCLHPEREPFENIQTRRQAVLEMRRPSADMLTVGEMAALNKCAKDHIVRLTQLGKIVCVKVRGIRYYQKDQAVPAPVLQRKRLNGAWALNFDECQTCGTSRKTRGHQHAAKGLCKNCREKSIRLAKKQAAG